MLTKTLITVALAGSLTLAGCAHQGPKEQAGSVIGGIAGGVLGHQVGSGSGRTAATIVGTLAGAAIGGSVGRSMDAEDRRQMAYTLENSRTGHTSTWKNPDTGYNYAMTPTRTYESSSGPCREFTMDARVDGRPETVRGTACRQSDGTWKIVD